MSELKIPERAIEAAQEAFRDSWGSPDEFLPAALIAAAPIILAAKLRSLELRLACREDRALVLAEVDELDPPAVGR